MKTTTLVAAIIIKTGMPCNGASNHNWKTAMLAANKDHVVRGTPISNRCYDRGQQRSKAHCLESRPNVMGPATTTITFAVS
jgi:hypothetical protein